MANILIADDEKEIVRLLKIYIVLTSRNFRPKNLALQIIIPDYL